MLPGRTGDPDEVPGLSVVAASPACDGAGSATAFAPESASASSASGRKMNALWLGLHSRQAWSLLHSDDGDLPRQVLEGREGPRRLGRPGRLRPDAPRPRAPRGAPGGRGDLPALVDLPFLLGRPRRVPHHHALRLPRDRRQGPEAPEDLAVPVERRHPALLVDPEQDVAPVAAALAPPAQASHAGHCPLPPVGVGVEVVVRQVLGRAADEAPVAVSSEHRVAELRRDRRIAILLRHPSFLPELDRRALPGPLEVPDLEQPRSLPDPPDELLRLDGQRALRRVHPGAPVGLPVEDHRRPARGALRSLPRSLARVLVVLLLLALGLRLEGTAGHLDRGVERRGALPLLRHHLPDRLVPDRLLGPREAQQSRGTCAPGT